MMTGKQQTKGCIEVIVGSIIILTIISIVFGLVWPALHSKAGATLPPRIPPTPTPTPISNQDDDDDDSLPLGAYIELQNFFAHSC